MSFPWHDCTRYASRHLPTTDRPGPFLTAPPLLTDSAAQAAACATFARETRLALDTEFLRERTYVAELALVQLGTESEVALLDPLCGADPAPLAALLTAPSVTKVLHAARQDVEVLLPLTGVPAAPLLDTQIAAGLIGLAPQIGYADLVMQVLDVELAKSGSAGNLARTDWTRRPLSEAQLLYAADDVRHLLALAAALEHRLTGLGRLEWWYEDCRALNDPQLYVVQPADAWRRLKGVDSLPAREQLAIRALAAWREDKARQYNLPRSWVLGDDGLRELAHRPPATLSVLKSRRVFRDETADRVGEEILALFSTVASASTDGITQTNKGRPAPEEEALHKLLTERVRTVAEQLDISPEILATQKELRRLARGDRTAQGPLGGWRADVVGTRLLEILDSRTTA